MKTTATTAATTNTARHSRATGRLLERRLTSALDHGTALTDRAIRATRAGRWAGGAALRARRRRSEARGGADRAPLYAWRGRTLSRREVRGRSRPLRGPSWPSGLSAVAAGGLSTLAGGRDASRRDRRRGVAARQRRARVLHAGRVHGPRE